jgi:hypothetical protein
MNPPSTLPSAASILQGPAPDEAMLEGADPAQAHPPPVQALSAPASKGFLGEPAQTPFRKSQALVLCIRKTLGVRHSWVAPWDPFSTFHIRANRKVCPFRFPRLSLVPTRPVTTLPSGPAPSQRRPHPAPGDIAEIS